MSFGHEIVGKRDQQIKCRRQVFRQPSRCRLVTAPDPFDKTHPKLNPLGQILASAWFIFHAAAQFLARLAPLT